LSVVHSTLQRLVHREPPLVKLLARQPGMKEARYAQLLSGDAQENAQAPAVGRASSTGADSNPRPSEARVAALESEIAALKDEIAALKQQFADFRKQFE
jgi:uncharacterized protein